MLKVKLQYFGHLMQRTESLVKTLLLGKVEAEEEDEVIGQHHQYTQLSPLSMTQ